MNAIIVYDIPDDRLRAKVADICLDYGLQRIQYSAFLGTLAPSRQEELLMKIKKRAGKKEANVQIFPICERCWAKRQVWVQKAKKKASPSGSAT
ncbi:MAG: CRISPR-associated endonuclease Cas2 [Chloroflexi bacterium]|nr:CRISPR-associated endonuclease Cas2 [Chloroflexota bacterium]